MTYLPSSGAGEFVLNAAWCSTANKPTGCTAVAGVCKPMTSTTLEQFKAMQRQLNRLLAARGSAPIDVDGRIGTRTLAAINRFESVTGSSYGSCDGAARDAGVLTSKFMNEANRLGAPAKVPEPAPKSPPSVASGGGVAHPPDDVINRTKGGILDTLSVKVAGVGNLVGLDATTSKMAVGGVAVLGALYLFTRYRKRRGGVTPAAAAIAPISNPRRRRRR